MVQLLECDAQCRGKRTDVWQADRLAGLGPNDSHSTHLRLTRKLALRERAIPSPCFQMRQFLAALLFFWHPNFPYLLIILFVFFIIPWE